MPQISLYVKARAAALDKVIVLLLYHAEYTNSISLYPVVYVKMEPYLLYHRYHCRSTRIYQHIWRLSRDCENLILHLPATLYFNAHHWNGGIQCNYQEIGFYLGASNQ